MLVPTQANYADKLCPSESSDAVCLCIRHGMSKRFFFVPLNSLMHLQSFKWTTKQWHVSCSNLLRLVSDPPSCLLSKSLRSRAQALKWRFRRRICVLCWAARCCTNVLIYKALDCLWFWMVDCSHSWSFLKLDLYLAVVQICTLIMTTKGFCILGPGCCTKNGTACNFLHSALRFERA